MIDQFAFLGDKHKAAIAVAMSLGVLLLLPASLGFGGGTIIIQEAFGQFNLPLLEEEETDETEEENGGGLVVEEEETTTTTTTTTTTPPPTTTTDVGDAATYMINEVNRDALRGLIGSTLPTQGVASGTSALIGGGDDDDDYDGNDIHIANGRFRLFANDTIVRRFITEMNVAAIDGSSYHNITMEEDAPNRFPATQDNGTTTAAASSSIVGRIYLDGGATPVINNVPMTISIRSQVLAIEDINIDESRIIDPVQWDVLSIIDGQTIYGIVT